MKNQLFNIEEFFEDFSCKNKDQKLNQLIKMTKDGDIFSEIDEKDSKTSFTFFGCDDSKKFLERFNCWKDRLESIEV